MRSSQETIDLARQAGAQVFHEVFKDDMATGRRFSSLISAQRYADAIGGRVKPASP